MRTPAALALAVAVLACGEEWKPSEESSAPPPNVAGTYDDSNQTFPMWRLTVLRASDGFSKVFDCAGRVTLSQSRGGTTRDALSGFVVVGAPCEPVSFPLTGTVDQGGGIVFTTEGPRPPEGPCPGGRSMEFSGQVVFYRVFRELSATARTTVSCPGFGEHSFTYRLRGIWVESTPR